MAGTIPSYSPIRSVFPGQRRWMSAELPLPGPRPGAESTFSVTGRFVGITDVPYRVLNARILVGIPTIDQAADFANRLEFGFFGKDGGRIGFVNNVDQSLIQANGYAMDLDPDYLLQDQIDRGLLANVINYSDIDYSGFVLPCVFQANFEVL